MTFRIGVLLAVLAVTAGCSGLLDGGSAGEPTATLTPAPVDADADRLSGANLPPGVRANGTVDAGRLSRAHRRWLEGRSYTWVLNQTQVTRGNTSVSNFTNRRRVRADESAVLVEESGTPMFPNQSRYLTDRGGYIYRAADDQPRVALFNETRGDRRYDIAEEILESAFTPNQTVELDAVERDGRRYVRVHAPPRSAPAGLFGTSSGVFRYTVTAYVTPDGFVESIVARYDFFSGRRVIIRFAYSAVDTTTVSRPDWMPAGDPGRPTPGSNATDGNATTAAPEPTTTTAPGTPADDGGTG